MKFGKTGQFLACTGYPACRYTSNYTRDEQGQIHLQEKVKPEFEKVGTCPECGKDLVLKRSRTGSRFIACSGYPDCKHAEPYSTGVPCPREGCNGVLVEKKFQARQDILLVQQLSPVRLCPVGLAHRRALPGMRLSAAGAEKYQGQGQVHRLPRKDLQIHARPLEGGSEDDAE